jgi:hypothetical protein
MITESIAELSFHHRTLHGAHSNARPHTRGPRGRIHWRTALDREHWEPSRWRRDPDSHGAPDSHDAPDAGAYTVPAPILIGHRPSRRSPRSSKAEGERGRDLEIANGREVEAEAGDATVYLHEGMRATGDAVRRHCVQPARARRGRSGWRRRGRDAAELRDSGKGRSLRRQRCPRSSTSHGMRSLVPCLGAQPWRARLCVKSFPRHTASRVTCGRDWDTEAKARSGQALFRDNDLPLALPLATRFGCPRPSRSVIRMTPARIHSSRAEATLRLGVRGRSRPHVEPARSSSGLPRAVIAAL